MPRPGQRPYDCVRRAWHSDRHQPIRGTLIQEIFRVVNEIHGSATKKNKEYQEKLPVVVLRAEEIMYSKANSEAEYVDLTTLLDRTNDAIDTIIRREQTESGEYLRPCIEAALSLGCCLRKASRSQRDSPRCYLSRSTEEVPNVSHDTVQKADGGDHAAFHCVKFLKTTSLKSTHLGSEPRRLVFRNDEESNNNALPFASENVPSTSTKKPCLEHQPASNLFSVYPLYYGNNNHFDESQHGFKISHKSVSNPFRPAIMGVAQNTLASRLNASSQGSNSFIIKGDTENPCTNICDLSLRLGPLNIPAPSFDCAQVQETEVRSKFIVQAFQKDESMRVQPAVQKWNEIILKDQQVCLQPQILGGNLRN